MTINDSITDTQQGIRIINEVGELYQLKVIEMLLSLTYNNLEIECEAKAQKVIRNMKREYILNIANGLWKDKFEEIPQYLKEW